MSDKIKALGMVIESIKRREEGKPAPMATCPSCKEPLVMTFKFPGKEFICVKCRKLWGFLDPTPAEATPELIARHDELEVRWRKEANDVEEIP